jgi:uncharacterized protein
MRTFLGPDAYSYVFDGQWGYLDHALGRQPDRPGHRRAEWHINADEPSVLDYNTNFKKMGDTGINPVSPVFRSGILVLVGYGPGYSGSCP